MQYSTCINTDGSILQQLLPCPEIWAAIGSSRGKHADHIDQLQHSHKHVSHSSLLSTPKEVQAYTNNAQ